MQCSIRKVIGYVINYLYYSYTFYKMLKGGGLVKARLILSVVTVLLILVLVFWSTSIDFSRISIHFLNDLGILFAALGLLLLFFQFVFSSRIRFIEYGFGLDKMMRWHRLFGRIGLALILLHAIFIVYYRLSLFGDTFFTVFILVGIIALVGFMVTGALASQYRRIGLAYETWRNIHLINYLLFPVALVHVFYHTLPGSLLSYLWYSLAFLYPLLLIYRLIRIVAVRMNPYEVTEVKQEAEKIWTLFFKGKKLDYKPGQFLFLQLLREGERSSTHPFTISNSPTRSELSVTPKIIGDFTLTIKDTRVGDKVFIDAPYGVFSFLNQPLKDLVFIAGGIGITPFISMIRNIYDQNLDYRVALFWVNRSENNLCFTGELKQIEQELDNFKVVFIMTDQPDWPGEKGRLNAQFIKEYLGDMDKKAFFICGPPAMSAELERELKEFDVPKSNIYREIFEL